MQDRHSKPPVSRVLRYGANASSAALKSNPLHDIAHRHAMSIYGANAVYSMIPKNGCSTLRLSIAMANGLLFDPRDWRWIHHNNDAFRPTLRELALASYTFTILRCPFARLVSCFLDKIVSRRAEAWQFHELTGASEPARLTFRQFCIELARPGVRGANIHWRPQVDFLIYKQYDDIFCFEDFAAAAATLSEKIGLKMVDSRPLVRHDSSQHAMLPAAKCFVDTEVWQIEGILMSGLRPSPVSFYDADLRDLVAAAYASDFKLYDTLFKGRGLFDAGERLAVAS